MRDGRQIAMMSRVVRKRNSTFRSEHNQLFNDDENAVSLVVLIGLHDKKNSGTSQNVPGNCPIDKECPRETLSIATRLS